MDKVYIVVFEDSCIQLYGRDTGRENFNKTAKCYSCGTETTVDTIREFIYTLNCNINYGSFGKVFTQVW